MSKSSKLKSVGRRLRLPLLIITILILLVETGLPLKAELGLIKLYRKHGSHRTAKIAKCLYQPSCSAYALETLNKDGFWKGNSKLTGRILMCSPLGHLHEWMGAEPMWEPAPERKESAPESPAPQLKTNDHQPSTKAS